MPGAVVAGTGFGCRVHVPALRNAGFDVVALVGRDLDRTKRRAARCDVDNAYMSLAEALTLDGVDAVTIATPPNTHSALAREACASGRHVICEKPFALDSSEAERMLAAAEAAGVTHLVGHEFRWSPERAVAARAIAEGRIGEPRTFTLVSYVPLVADPETRLPEWWFDASSGGGWLGASGSHVVDQLRTWLGEIASVSASFPSIRDAGADDTFVVRVTMRNGAHGVVQQTAASWAPSVVSLTVVAGTQGTLEVAGDRCTSLIVRAVRCSLFRLNCRCRRRPGRPTIRASGSRTSSSAPTRAFARYCVQASSNGRTNRPCAQRPSPTSRGNARPRCDSRVGRARRCGRHRRGVRSGPCMYSSRPTARPIRLTRPVPPPISCEALTSSHCSRW